MSLATSDMKDLEATILSQADMSNRSYAVGDQTINASGDRTLNASGDRTLNASGTGSNGFDTSGEALELGGGNPSRVGGDVSGVGGEGVSMMKRTTTKNTTSSVGGQLSEHTVQAVENVGTGEVEVNTTFKKQVSFFFFFGNGF